jgi:hypothetical protein
VLPLGTALTLKVDELWPRPEFVFKNTTPLGLVAKYPLAAFTLYCKGVPIALPLKFSDVCVTVISLSTVLTPETELATEAGLLDALLLKSTRKDWLVFEPSKVLAVTLLEASKDLCSVFVESNSCVIEEFRFKKYRGVLGPNP